MNEINDLSALCPKCGNKINGPLQSPSTEVSRIDKNDTSISITGLLKNTDGIKNVKIPFPAWGYTCDKCGVLFAIGQKKSSIQISNEEMKDKLTKISEGKKDE